MYKLAIVSTNPGEVHFKCLVHLLRCIGYNNTFGLKYYANINDALVYELLRQTSIKTKNELTAILILVVNIVQKLAEV